MGGHPLDLPNCGDALEDQRMGGPFSQKKKHGVLHSGMLKSAVAKESLNIFQASKLGVGMVCVF